MGEPPGLRIAERIRQRLAVLSPSERRVARVLLSGPPTIGLESSARLAQHAGVSGPTISRFVTHQLGFENYAAFQRALREEISARVLSPVEVYRQYQGQQEPANLLSQAGARLGESVAASVSSLDRDELGQAAALLGDTRYHALAIGGWFSQLAAGYLVSVLRELRPGVRLVLPVPAERAAALADLSRKDVIAVFDFRRYERDTHDFASAAHAAGARIVLFTDPWLSPIADIADALLPAEVDGPSPFESLTPTIAVVETLLTAVADSLGDAARAHFERFGGIADRWIRSWPTATEPAAAAGLEPEQEPVTPLGSIVPAPRRQRRDSGPGPQQELTDSEE
ncbi:MAG TPA: MurR/RpiR family transcriptional regulator [Streptosporangiaceae bacterium]|nr:MurR/RpiR family transcriptional regulator [Streptosporangiaceae bacterium]